MGSKKHIPDLDASEDPEIKNFHTPEPEDEEKKNSSPPRSTLSHRFREPPQKPREDRKREKNSDDSIAVMVPAPARPWEYQPYRGDTTVDTIIELKVMDDREWYTIDYEDGKRELVPLEKLLALPNGPNALDIFEIGEEEIEDSQDNARSSVEPGMSSSAGKRNRTMAARDGFVSSSMIPVDFGTDEDLSEDDLVIKKRRLEKGRVSNLTNRSSRQGSRQSSRLSSRPQSRANDDDESSESDVEQPNGRGPQPTHGGWVGRTTRSSTAKPIITLHTKTPRAFEGDESDELAGDAPDESEGSEIVFWQRNQKNKTAKGRQGRSDSRGKRGRPRRFIDDESSPEPQPATRRSGRDRVVKNMRERDMEEEIFADEVVVNNVPKVISIREIFKPVPKDSPFRIFHNKDCDVCGGSGTNSNKGPSILIFCQGCSTSIHKVCLGYRSGRDHMVTKVGHENFVMQCRRCIGVATKKDPLAPPLDVCQGCKEKGASCAAFSPKRTNKQEEKLREENDGDDPIAEVSETLMNNSENLLFRCTSCVRAYHFDHLPGLSKFSKTPENVDDLREVRLKEYSQRWQCKECQEVPAKVDALVAWRPMDRESYIEGQTIENLREDEKEYLIKWQEMSHFKCTWMPGAWVWGVTVVIMRNAFIRRDDGVNLLPKWTSEEAIPEEFLRMEIVFDVNYAKGFTPKSESADKAAIHMVDEVLVKFQGLGYDDAVWEEPPELDDKDRWSDFVAAYNEYVAGQYFKNIPATTIKERVDDFRSMNFEKKVELKKQPTALTGGEMMPYQMEGLNWLLYNFHQQKNVILADEMGLGKTIQIISLFASLVKGNPKCWPFLVVTPNSTCPNWRREIKKWTPALRVVTYYGGKKARNMAMKYELYPNGCSDLRAHVVVTSYEGPTDDSSRSFFRKVKWAGMVVDEGQRLKNDENQLYIALKALKIPYQVLLTGTPLQNNKRELFNLLQFLDKSMNAAELDEKYEELTKENLPELHELIRPFFLRRTKLQVLKFLPPMAQVILPVTMSLVQKKLYKSILAKNPELIRSIFGQSKTALRPAERGNLNNILMQLRKCLCHPFVYSQAIEERTVGEAALHRNLVDASSKFQLLEIMLPKLRERGHRVLIFSQFLDQLDLVEDFLNVLDLPFQRLDGRIGALEKQKRIDQFNAPDSPLFAFLLSTRAGGVGINLATADTVIIMDPDFNPHQDIQALSRAHRIGQKNKVLVFQLMTKDSAEEKIVQIGRKKMALDQALIESMGAEDDAGVDLESILKHGAEALFNDDDRNDIHYDSVSVDKLLDRTKVENINTDNEASAENQFSFARVWANDKGTLTEDLGDADAEPTVPNFSVWDKILKQREADAAAEAARNMQTFGRGKRARQTVDYKKNVDLDDDMLDSSPMKVPSKHRLDESASDIDFAAGDSEGDDDSDGIGEVDPRELSRGSRSPKEHQPYSSGHSPQFMRTFKDEPRQPVPGFKHSPDGRYHQSNSHQVHSSSRPNADGHGRPTHTSAAPSHPNGFGHQFTPGTNHLHQNGLGEPIKDQRSAPSYPPILPPIKNGRRDNQKHTENFCQVCQTRHVLGKCTLRTKGIELCNLCGVAHIGLSDKCLLYMSEPQIRILLDDLRQSNKPKAWVEEARVVLRRELTRKSQTKQQKSRTGLPS
ncbi:hypothetical protein N431DRAFT_435109 [Stipitochalara longipes BDJ]|nr:hypothetical protein N431DRAFT_435109 [Stipitochalara longipes BDJ]